MFIAVFKNPATEPYPEILKFSPHAQPSFINTIPFYVGSPASDNCFNINPHLRRFIELYQSLRFSKKKKKIHTYFLFPPTCVLNAQPNCSHYYYNPLEG